MKSPALSLIKFPQTIMQTKPHRLPSTVEILLLAVLFAVLALIVLAQANPGTSSIRRDSGFYLYIGDQLLHGKTLYRDVWDHKPPAIYYLNALALWIGKGSRWGVWLVEFIFLFTAVCFSYISLNRLWGTSAALAGTSLWLYGLESTLQGGNLTEEYPLALHFISLFLFIRLLEQPAHRLFQFLLGVMLAATFLFRPNIAAIQILMGFVLLIAAWMQKRYKDILPLLTRVGIGAALPILFVAGYFGAKGLFKDLIDAAFTYNFAYSQTPLNEGSRIAAGFNILEGAAWIALGGYLSAIWLFKKDAHNRFVCLYLLLGTPLLIYVNDPAKRFYPHYFMSLLPFLALLGAALWRLIQTKVFSNIRLSSVYQLGGYFLLLAAAMLYFFQTDRAQGYINAVVGYRTDEKWMVERRSPVAAYVRSHTQPDDLVLFWGAYPSENFLSRRDAPTRALFYPLYVDSDVSTKLNDQFLHDLIANPPVLIVDMSDPLEFPSLDGEKRREQFDSGFTLIHTPANLEQVFDFIAQNYTMVETVSGRQVYRLNSVR